MEKNPISGHNAISPPLLSICSQPSYRTRGSSPIARNSRVLTWDMIGISTKMRHPCQKWNIANRPLMFDPEYNQIPRAERSSCLSLSTSIAWPAVSFLCWGTISATTNSMWWILSQSTHGLLHCSADWAIQKHFIYWSTALWRVGAEGGGHVYEFSISDKKPRKAGELLKRFERWNTKCNISVACILGKQWGVGTLSHIFGLPSGQNVSANANIKRRLTPLLVCWYFKLIFGLLLNITHWPVAHLCYDGGSFLTTVTEKQYGRR